MVGWHHQLNEYEFQQTAGGSEEQEAWHSAVHGVSKSDTTERWNNNKNKYCLSLVTTIPLSVSMDSNTS